MRGKFIGTVASKCLQGDHIDRQILFVALLDSPRMDSALMLHATTRLNSLVKRDAKWRVPVDAVVVNLAIWNPRFPDYSGEQV